MCVDRRKTLSSQLDCTFGSHFIQLVVRSFASLTSKMLRATGHARMVSSHCTRALTGQGAWCFVQIFCPGRSVRISGQPRAHARLTGHSLTKPCGQTLSGPLPQSGSPAREARGAAAAAPQGRQQPPNVKLGRNVRQKP